MNRAQRRASGSESKSNIKNETQVIRNLSKEQLKLIDHIASIKATQISDKRFEEFTSNLDRNISAALIFLGFSIKQTYHIENLIAELTEEDSIKYTEFKKIYKSQKEFEEIMKDIDKELRKEIEIVIEKGVSKKQAIEDLRFKFTTLSKSMIINAYQKVKEELDKSNEDDLVDMDADVKEALEYIFPEDVENEKLEQNAEKIIETAKEIQCKDINKVENAIANRLQVLSMTVKGENGTYKVCEKGVELSNDGFIMTFENSDELEKFIAEYREVFKMANNR